MSALSALLADPARAGVFQLAHEARDVARACGEARLACFIVDIGHAHDKADFLKKMAQALRFPDWFGNNWDALADCLKDLSWLEDSAAAAAGAATGTASGTATGFSTLALVKGYVLVLEKSKHFGAAHRHEFDEAMDLLGEVADYWRIGGTPFWTLIGGPEGWSSGWPAMPAA
ncbi:MAG: hypothetical protein EXR27_09895 [Betaproteobacteria bacterium]|nr:hypothetical protein [Betaproteobacteria bacterium]